MFLQNLELLPWSRFIKIRSRRRSKAYLWLLKYMTHNLKVKRSLARTGPMHEEPRKSSLRNQKWLFYGVGVKTLNECSHYL